MRRSAALPLGIDVGASRVRIAYARRERRDVQLVAVAARDVEPGLGEDADALAAVIDDLGRELGRPTRSAVIALSPAEAIVAHLRFPAMRWNERRRAAAFEAERFAPWIVKEARSRVRVHAVDGAERIYAVGIAKEATVAERVRQVKRGGFRVAGIDYAAHAMRRAFPSADAVIDVGLRRSAVYAFSPRGPVAAEIAGGGERVTAAVAAELSIDSTLAEKRKRILGTAGAGDPARHDLAAQLCVAITKLREQMPVRRIAMAGNGARLCGLAAEIEATTGAIVEVPVSDVLRSGSYADDVLRAAAPDWTLAAALSTWDAQR